MAIDRFRRLKGALGNAFVFAVGWTVGAFLLWFPLRQAGILPHIQVIDGIGIAIRFGVVGFITGFVFPTLMRFLYKGHRLQEISWWKFGLAGAVVAGLFVPTWMQVMNILTGGGGVPFALIRMDIVSTALLGAIASAISIKLAQYADRLFPDTVHEQFERITENIERLQAPRRDEAPRKERRLRDLLLRKPERDSY
jgi:hypothetical protein